MNQKGFTNIVLIVLVMVLAGAVGYFALRKLAPAPITEQPTPTQGIPPTTTQTPTPQALSPIFYQKDSTWGPCPTGQTCAQTIQLYSSGKLILTGNKEGRQQLSDVELRRIENQIRQSGIMEKDCSNLLYPADTWYKYTINLDGKSSKIIGYDPICEEVLWQIDKLILGAY